MYCSANKLRLSHLKLDGYRPTDTVWFCARPCGFVGALPAIECPLCGAPVEAGRVPDVIEARAEVVRSERRAILPLR
jgi:hypothetical protein